LSQVWGIHKGIYKGDPMMENEIDAKDDDVEIPI
jgi:hypothetical protein